MSGELIERPRLGARSTSPWECALHVGDSTTCHIATVGDIPERVHWARPCDSGAGFMIVSVECCDFLRCI